MVYISGINLNYIWKKQFYSSVILNGIKTTINVHKTPAEFYSSVILNGIKTVSAYSSLSIEFYSSVILNGIKTVVSANPANS